MDQLHAELRALKTKNELDRFYFKSIQFREEHIGSISWYESNYMKRYFLKNQYSSHGDFSDIYSEYNDRFSPTYLECGGECIDMVIIINNASIRDASKQTPSIIDDEFVDIVVLVYGEQSFSNLPNRFKWIEYWSDEDHSCNIGNNAVFERLDAILKFNDTYPIEYTDEVAELLQGMGNSIFEEEKFLLPKDEVVVEFSKIELIEGLPESLKIKVAEEITRINGLEAEAFSA